MGIRLDWVDGNALGNPTTIYRSTSPMTDDALPAPLTTVAGGVYTYLDDTALRNVLYYYRISTLGPAGNEELIITPNKAMAFMPYTGPGPQALLRGNWECGYFGRMPMSQLFGASELIDFSGVAMTEQVVANEWHKFVFKGKIYFFPKLPLAVSYSWESLYRAGLVFGEIPDTQWPAIVKTNFGIITQKKEISLANHLFGIRLPTSRANPLSTGTTPADQTGGEIDTLMSLVSRQRTYPDPVGRPQVDDVDYSNVYSMTTDTLATAFCINRGQTTTDAINTGLGLSLTNAQHGWRPLLTLVL